MAEHALRCLHQRLRDLRSECVWIALRYEREPPLRHRGQLLPRRGIRESTDGTAELTVEHGTILGRIAYTKRGNRRVNLVK